MKNWIWILTGCICVLLLKEIYIWQIDGFTVKGLSTDRIDPKEKVLEEGGELEEALSQSYTYKTRGGQCFVFFSEDSKYVLKCFKQSLYELPLWSKLLRPKKKEKKEVKRIKDFRSCHIAFENFKEESQLLYVHLNRTEHLKKLKVIDRLGFSHSLDLNRCDFVLQRRVDLIYPTIDRLMGQGDLEKPKILITRILEFIPERCKRGFFDGDPNIQYNCGLLDDHIVKIDVGRLIPNETMKQPEVYKKELLRISAPFKKWIDETHPKLSNHFESEITRLLAES